jgi:MscS family membrane protein
VKPETGQILGRKCACPLAAGFNNSAGMRLKFETFFRGYLFLMVLGLLWSVWRVMAQSNAPSVELAAPLDNARFNPGTNITLRAIVPNKAHRVEFMVNGQPVGVVSNASGSTSFTWTNAPAGTYKLSAKASLEGGGVTESAAIHVRVYNALVTFGLDRVPILEVYQPFGIPLWQYVASLIYIFLAFYVSKVLDFLTRVWLKRWAEKTETKFDDLLLDLLNGPVKVISFIIFLRIGLEVFSWPAMVQKFLTKGFTIIVAMSLTYTVLKFIDLMLGYWKQRAGDHRDKAFDEQLFPIIRKSLKVFTVVIAVLVTLDNIGVNITAAIASLSIGGLAIGLAAQDTLANLFGAVAVFIDKPFRVGDRIKVDTVDGNVETIGLRSTRVRTLDGHLASIPNKTVGNATIVNVTERPTIKTEMNIGVTYDTSAEKLRLALQIIDEVYRSHPKTADLIVSFNRFADSSLNILVVHWWNDTDVRQSLSGMQEMNLKLKERFDAERIEFAYPTQTVYVKKN